MENEENKFEEEKMVKNNQLEKCLDHSEEWH